MKKSARENEMSVEKQTTQQIEVSRLSKFVNDIGIYGIVLLFIVLGVVLETTGVIKGFMSIRNMMNIIDAVAILGIAAVGLSFVPYSGSFNDMSIPTTMALTGIVAIQMLKYGFVVSLISALVVGIIIGSINGLTVGKLGVNPVIWTLAINYVTMGVIRLVWVNKQIYPDMMGASEQSIRLFDDIFRYRVFGVVGLPVVVLIVMVIIAQLVLSKTVFGFQIKFTGSSKLTAKLSGINVNKIVVIAFILSSLAATISGLMITSLGRVGAWYNGSGYDFKAMTAVVIGGTSLAGGRGSVIGVLGGAIVMGVMSNIMTLLGIGTFSQDMISGAIFILVVGINAKTLRNLGRDYA